MELLNPWVGLWQRCRGLRVAFLPIWFLHWSAAVPGPGWVTSLPAALSAAVCCGEESSLCHLHPNSPAVFLMTANGSDICFTKELRDGTWSRVASCIGPLWKCRSCAPEAVLLLVCDLLRYQLLALQQQQQKSMPEWLAPCSEKLFLRFRPSLGSFICMPPGVAGSGVAPAPPAACHGLAPPGLQSFPGCPLGRLVPWLSSSWCCGSQLGCRQGSAGCGAGVDLRLPNGSHICAPKAFWALSQAPLALWPLYWLIPQFPTQSGVSFKWALLELVGNQANGVSLLLYLLRVLIRLLAMAQTPWGSRRHQKLSKKLQDFFFELLFEYAGRKQSGRKYPVLAPHVLCGRSFNCF